MTKSGLAMTRGSDDSGAMAAKRIWIARPEPGATRTADRLRDLGFAPLVAPVLVVATSDARPPEGPFAAVLVTSANALGRARDWRHLHHIPVFAVGARTASLARRQGFAAVTTAEGDAASLARLVRSALPAGASLLHAAGEDRKAEPAATLTAAGFRLTTFIAYGAKPVAALPPMVAAAFDGPDALSGMLHYSRRSAATARDLAAAAGYGGAFAALRHYCLSADVAVPLAEAGITAHFVARQASEDALFAGLGSGF